MTTFREKVTEPLRVMRSVLSTACSYDAHNCKPDGCCGYTVGVTTCNVHSALQATLSLV